MNGFDLHLRTRVVFGNGAFERLGDLDYAAIGTMVKQRRVP